MGGVAMGTIVYPMYSFQMLNVFLPYILLDPLKVAHGYTSHSGPLK